MAACRRGARGTLSSYTSATVRRAKSTLVMTLYIKQAFWLPSARSVGRSVGRSAGAASASSLRRPKQGKRGKVVRPFVMPPAALGRTFHSFVIIHSRYMLALARLPACLSGRLLEPPLSRLTTVLTLSTATTNKISRHSIVSGIERQIRLVGICRPAFVGLGFESCLTRKDFNACPAKHTSAAGQSWSWS